MTSPCDAVTVFGGTIAAAALVLLSLHTGGRTMCLCRETNGDIAGATVKKFAYEAYPSWREVHGSNGCPVSLDELLHYMNDKTNMDPWGSPYDLFCSAGAIVVRSRGEDTSADTPDDIWSR